MNTGEMNGATLAYLGDAVLELLVRRSLIERGIGGVGEMNGAADAMVRAGAQSAAMEKLLPLLTEEELAVYKRGRNSHPRTVPKSASVAEYRRASGMEALFGYLYLEGRHERLGELLRAAYY